MEIDTDGSYSDDDHITNPDKTIPIVHQEDNPNYPPLPDDLGDLNHNADTKWQGTRWCYTSFLASENPIFTDDECRYRIEGIELCPTTGKRHIQGFAWFHKNMRFSALKKRYPSNIRFILCRGSPYQNFIYCSKDNNFTEFGTRPVATKTRTDSNHAYKLALAAPSVREGMEIIKLERARDYCLYYETIERSLKKAKMPAFCALFQPGDFNIPLFGLKEEKRSWLFSGPSGIGKTQFAIAHFSKPLVVSHMDNLKQLSPDHDGIVFDDMSFNHIPVESVIHLLDYDLTRTLHVRYGTVDIPAKTIKVFTHNTDNPFYNIDTIKSTQLEAIERRLKVVYLKVKLFS